MPTICVPSRNGRVQQDMVNVPGSTILIYQGVHHCTKVLLRLGITDSKGYNYSDTT